MADYNRTTRECLVSQLHPELRQAIQNYAHEHKLSVSSQKEGEGGVCPPHPTPQFIEKLQLGDLEAEILICCETISKRESMGRLLSWLNGDADTTIYTGTLLTPQWLIWVRSGDRTGVGLSAARLTDIRVKAYMSVLTRDIRLEVVGYLGDAPHRVQGYIGLGAGGAAEKFCAAVQEAISKANPPFQKGLFRWLKGY